MRLRKRIPSPVFGHTPAPHFAGFVRAENLYFEVKSITCEDFENIVTAALVNRLPGTYLAAVSGGADSTAMLTALAVIKKNVPEIKLRCIHVEHGIRPAEESRGDAEFVRSFCTELKVPCCIVHIPPGKIAEFAKKRGIGIEAAARFYRRKIWFREAKKLEGPVRILVAHNEDDMLETLLMRILRGAGPSGLSAMPVNKGRILRPLLTLSRSDIINYLREKNIQWREDATNTDFRFFRNSVRGRLVPLLAAEYPDWRKALTSLGQTQTLTANFINNEANSKSQASNNYSLYTDAANFFAQPAIIREEALFQGINKLFKSAHNFELSSTIKRKNIRRFCEEKITDADLGLLHLKRDLNQIILLLKYNPHSLIPIPQSPFPFPHSHSEYGFSLLINTPGFYTLKGIDIEVCENQADGNDKNTFFARPPLLIRRCFKDDFIGKNHAGKNCEFTVVDTSGPAAFIGAGTVIWRRDEIQPFGPGCNLGYWLVKMNSKKSNGE
jgi:tRNA(Ile)-lysidine synthase